MTLLEAGELPTLEEAFGRYPYLLGILREKNRVNTIAPLMVLSREALLKLRQVGPATADRIAGVLQRHSLGQYDVNAGELFPFLDEEFGRAEDAPVGVLHAAISRNWDTYSMEYAPLQLIEVLEAKEPSMTVGQLLEMAEDLLSCAVQLQLDGTSIPIDQQLGDYRADIKHTRFRMAAVGFGLPMIKVPPIWATNQ